MLRIITALLLAGVVCVAQAKNVVLHTNYGDIKMVLEEEKAPISTQNFLRYSQAGFYNGTIFHRVIPGFMIQAGGFEVGMKQKKTDAPITNEANNGLKNLRGTVAMARTSDPHSATAQFFINTVDNDFLNFSAETQKGWGYAVFANVVAGMDVVDRISQVDTERSEFHRDVPKAPVIIKSVTIE
ncbi:TPA: peptidylprolyl isomerase [Pasteurella multocida]|uniref:peptidylprolyl isomerase n=1 Tax=Pasteurella multocida TaxID=747 RepID=UPI0009BDC8AE|nr:peptidylprolyl isomerase [Pasteurella multocida]MCL7789276.1 peptidylprolyl isomerase [Pasteurella multocida]PNM08225.1 peptidylprolyl isomerase [Pasteurella multocida]HDR1288128.1 peptidylprolyl isomerase [Pasteurella multocida]HDR1416151.1 peptidylprolyl isomerase [Pasteurella multocida]HDR1435763.1 peptidylprolyl isomerase [Pasteurella multocida]